MSIDKQEGADTEAYSRERQVTGRGAKMRFGEEHCPVYQEDMCDGYGEDEFCENCRYITEFVDWWSQEADELREFHALLHGSGQLSSA